MEKSPEQFKEKEEVKKEVKEEIMEDREKKLMDKIFIAEDKETEIAEKTFGEGKYVKDLASAFKEMEDSSDKYDMIITDLFYPLGQVKDKKEFYERLGGAIEDCFIVCMDFPLERHGYGEEIKNYIELVRKGEADEVPSGMLLGINALLKHGIIPLWITSQEHHSAKSEVMTWFLRGPISEYGFWEGDYLTEGINEQGEKRWDEVFQKASNLIKKGRLPREKIETMHNDRKLMNLDIVKLALDLPKYFGKEIE